MGVYKSGGVRELFAGVKAACLRMMVASPVQLVSYDITKVCERREKEIKR